LWQRWDAADVSVFDSGSSTRWTPIDLDSGEVTRFPYTDDRLFAHVMAWSNIELIKKVAEMAQLRRIARVSLCAGRSGSH
jgi:hypothetical protein